MGIVAGCWSLVSGPSRWFLVTGSWKKKERYTISFEGFINLFFPDSKTTVFYPFDWCINFRILFVCLIFSIFHYNASILEVAYHN